MPSDRPGGGRRGAEAPRLVAPPGQTHAVRELRGRVAVVTGAAGGIGRGIADAFATEGMRLVVADVDGSALARQADRWRTAGVEVEAVVTDVADADAVEALAVTTIERFGAVHLVCNNAGIIRPGRTWELPLADWERVLRVNVLGVVHGVRSFVPHLLEAGARGEEGHVVNVASMAAVVPVPGIGPYNVAKHGVLALSETLHAEAGVDGRARGRHRRDARPGAQRASGCRRVPARPTTATTRPASPSPASSSPARSAA